MSYFMIGWFILSLTSGGLLFFMANRERKHPPSKAIDPRDELFIRELERIDREIVANMNRKAAECPETKN